MTARSAWVTQNRQSGNLAGSESPDEHANQIRQARRRWFCLLPEESVQAAIDAGLSKSEVHRLAGMARTILDRIAGTIAAMEQDPR